MNNSLVLIEAIFICRLRIKYFLVSHNEKFEEVLHHKKYNIWIYKCINKASNWDFHL